MIIFLLLAILVYAATMAQLIYGYGKIKADVSEARKPQTFFSIVVPFRNEAQHLPALLESFRQLDYPVELFEIILVDDFSQDHSQRIVYNWRMQNGQFDFTLLENIKISGSPKKDAIARAIPIAKQDWIVTTDADCIVPENWLLTLDNYIRQKSAAMLIAPVSYTEKKSLLQHFQQLNLAALQGATIGSFGLGLGFMCNGANFAYKKSLFLELGGFSGNTDKASGDDVFLLQKAVSKYPEKVHYLKSESAIVLTQPLTNWYAFFQQQARWAAKTSGYQSLFGKDLAVIVFLGNLSVLVALGLAAFRQIPWAGFAAVFAIKFIADTILLYQTNRFLTGKRMKGLLASSMIYPFFSVFVALYAVCFGYVWKGRKFKS